ncbi:MAG: YbaB/EbfC family nucleoid-associated protein [Treponemataceae bacterium]|nr:YbaB/EbfC family nucleoid-associated protein [Treponemataceae bacterium]
MNFNPMDLLKNAGAIKEELANAQEKLAEITATGSAGGGLVKVTMNGKFEVTELHIDPIAVDPRDVKMLEDIIVAALHQASSNVQDEIKNSCGPMLGQFMGK